MKSYIIFSSVCFLTLTAFSDNHESNKAKDLAECKNITAQCEAAGFKVGGHKENKNGVWVDCVGKVAKGETVTGVTATADEAKSCATAAKSLREEKKAKRAEKKKGS